MGVKYKKTKQEENSNVKTMLKRLLDELKKIQDIKEFDEDLIYKIKKGKAKRKKASNNSKAKPKNNANK